MNLDSEIEKAKAVFAKKALKYVQLVTYGNNTEEHLSDLREVNMLIKALERNNDRYINVKNKSVKKFVSFSSLKRENNTLILDSSTHVKCVPTKVRPCLSDQEVCSIIERVDQLSSSC